jgi:FkbM family methyltransferase
MGSPESPIADWSGRERAEPLISYSQNNEDIRLCRIFCDIEDGFYVDVGAGHPTEGSVSRLFYDRGWSGVNVEPSPTYEQLKEARSRDTNIRAVVGERDGASTPFFVTHPDVGMSTLDLSAHAHIADAIESFEEISVPQHRLETILREHAPGRTIHFLKVDVEGAERQVLASSDWSTYRPIVVVVEAVKSWSASPTHGEWERILTKADYELAAFDGVNRFYLEHSYAELAPALAYPVSALDRFEPAALRRSQREVGDLLAQIADLYGERDRIADEKGRLEADRRAMSDHIAALDRVRDRLESETEQLRSETEQLRSENEQLRSDLGDLYGSRTWRAGRIVARTASPAVVISERIQGLRRRRQTHLTPQRAYAQATASGQPWYFPPPGANATRIEPTALSGLLRALGTKRGPVDARVASRLAEAIDRTDWAEETSLLEKRLTWTERQAIVEADALTRVLAPATPEIGRQRSDPAARDRPLLLVDARCLQDAAYKQRGVGLHAQAVVRALNTSTRFRLRLLTSAELPGLDAAISRLAEDVVATPYVTHPADVALFLELSPMTASIAPATPYLLSETCRAAAVVYDFIPEEYPAAYLGSPAAMLANRIRTEALRHYDLLLPISRTTAAACQRILGPVPLVVTGVADPLRGVGRTRSRAHAPFILVPAGGDARKNCAAAVAALASYQRRGRPPLRLLVVGNVTPSQASALHELADLTGLGDGAVDVRYDMDANELVDLYECAELVFVGSLTEGFSIPVAEAVLRGTPVVASDIPAHRELLGTGAWLSPPGNVEKFADALEHVSAARAEVVASQRRALGDTADSDAVAERVTTALTQLLQADRRSPSAPLRRNQRPRLAVVTPYPPQQSGVADYTAFTLRQLATHADVEVYSSAPSRDSPIRVHPLSTAPFLDRRFDRVVTVVGNSHFHFPILDLLGCFGGACIAHDDRMVEAYGYDRGDAWAADFVSRRGRTVSADELTDALLDLDLLPSIGYEIIAAQASPLIVHSKALAHRIEEETGLTPVVLPFVPYNLPGTEPLDKATRSRARRDLGLSEDDFHVGTFGIVDRRTKGADVIVGALAWLRSWGIPARLHIVGSAPSGERAALDDMATELDIGSFVRFHGRVSRKEFERFLLAVDVAVQLRTSGMLSLSGGLADSIAYAVPTVTTNEMALELDAPLAYTRTVEPTTSSLLVAEEIEPLLQARREDGGTIETERQDYLRRRSVESYAQALLRALGMNPS